MDTHFLSTIGDHIMQPTIPSFAIAISACTAVAAYFIFTRGTLTEVPLTAFFVSIFVSLGALVLTLNIYTIVVGPKPETTDVVNTALATYLEEVHGLHTTGRATLTMPGEGAGSAEVQATTADGAPVTAFVEWPAPATSTRDEDIKEIGRAHV